MTKHPEVKRGHENHITILSGGEKGEGRSISRYLRKGGRIAIARRVGKSFRGKEGGEDARRRLFLSLREGERGRGRILAWVSSSPKGRTGPFLFPRRGRTGKREKITLLPAMKKAFNVMREN